MTTTIYICANDETLTDGHFVRDGNSLAEEAQEIFEAGADVVQSDARAECVASRFFHDWNGGRHRQGVGQVISGVRYGYSAGLVVTHAENPPPWLCELCDRAAQAMLETATKLGVAQSNDLARQIIEEIESGAVPDSFFVESISREEVEPALLARMDSALATLAETE